MAACLCAQPVLANDYSVSVATDDGSGTTANTLSWAIDQANNNPGPDNIILTTDVGLNGVMKKLIQGDTTVKNDGTVRYVSCSDQYRPFFVKASGATVVFDGLTVTHCSAAGGRGANGGGGGAGLGGALFIWDGAVTVQNSVLYSNRADGGGTGSGGGESGGGGMYGWGGYSGGGGLYASASGNTGGAADAGGFGGGGTGGGTDPGTGQCSDGGFGGGGGGEYATTNVTNGCGGGFGGGGGGAASYLAPGPAVTATGGKGGFGGGGGSASIAAPAGGASVTVTLGSGGFGGTSGTLTLGGSGAGFGGAIFVMKGSLTLKNVTLLANTAQGWNGAAGRGGALFICTPDLDSDASSAGASGSCGGSIDVAASCGVTFLTNFANTDFSSTYENYFWSDGTGVGGSNQRSLSIGACQAAPSASGVTLSGTAKQGQTLTGTYSYTDINGDAEETTGTGTSYRVVRSTDATLDGSDISVATGTTGGASVSYTATLGDVGNYLFFCVTPMAATGTLVGSESCSVASGPVAANAAPVASGVTLSGTAKQGIALTGSYSYSDGDSDTENATGTSYRVVRSTDATLDGSDNNVATGTTGGASVSYTVAVGDVGNYLFFCVTPKAATGTLVGSEVCSPASGPVVANAAPVASGVTLSGTAKQGIALTGSYSYSDGDSDTEETSATGSSYRFVRSVDAVVGAGDTDVATGTTGGAVASIKPTYTAGATEVGNYLIFCVTPKAATGTLVGSEVCSPASGPVVANAAPVASGVTLSGTAKQGIALTGSYSYSDNESDTEETSGSGSSYRFVRSADAVLGAGDTDVSSGTTAGAVASIKPTYTVEAADVGHYLFFCVTPKAVSGTLAGSETCSGASAQVVADAAPTASSAALVGTAQSGQQLTGTYSYSDAENDSEDTSAAGSSYRFVRSTDAGLDMGDSNVATGTTGGAGASAKPAYTVVAADVGNHLFFCVTPKAATGTPGGAESCSPASPRVTAATAVPALGPWALLMLPGLLGAGAATRLRRRRS